MMLVESKGFISKRVQRTKRFSQLDLLSEDRELQRDEERPVDVEDLGRGQDLEQLDIRGFA